MILAASLASNAVSALAQALQGKPKPGPAAQSGQSFAADIDALLSGSGSASGGQANPVGGIVGDLKALGQDVLSALGLGQGHAAPPQARASQAAQAYASSSALRT